MEEDRTRGMKRERRRWTKRYWKKDREMTRELISAYFLFGRVTTLPLSKRRKVVSLMIGKGL
jgi:hypothetical protein